MCKQQLHASQLIEIRKCYVTLMKATVRHIITLFFPFCRYRVNNQISQYRCMKRDVMSLHIALALFGNKFMYLTAVRDYARN